MNVDIILQSTGRDGKKDIIFTCGESKADIAMRTLQDSAHFKQLACDKSCAKVSIVGAGMQSHSGVASKMFEALSNNNINIKMISTSEDQSLPASSTGTMRTVRSAPSTICCLN